MDSDSIRSILVLGLLILASAYFSATETAFSSLNHIRIKNMAEKKDKRAVLVYKLLSNYDKLLSSVLVGNNIVNIAASSIATVLFIKHWGNAGPTISTIVMTVLLLIFGEISPKSLAKESPEKFAMFSAPILQIVVIFLTPINFAFSKWKLLLSKVFKTTDVQNITEEELLTLVEEAEQDGVIDEEDSRLIHSVIEYNDQIVDDILTPRVDMIGISKNALIEEISSLFVETGYSRILVFDGTSDNIIGVIHLKDFFDLVLNGKDTIDNIVAPVIFITPSMKISNLFKKFQQTKSHLAVVTDEYGGTAGIVTMEDILEELVGEIWDEHDEIIEDFVKLDDGTYKIICNAEIDKMFEFFKLTGDVDSTTVSGWIMEQLGKIPEEGDTFEYENLNVTVSKTDQRRVMESIVKLKAGDEEMPLPVSD